MSAELEQVFSGGRRTISWERIRLGEDTIKFLKCLKHWIRSGLVNSGLEEVEEEEDLDD